MCKTTKAAWAKTKMRPPQHEQKGLPDAAFLHCPRQTLFYTSIDLIHLLNMSFTRQHSIAGQQATIACSFSRSTLAPQSANHWRPTFICPSSVGSRSGQCGLPGFGSMGWRRSSTPSDGMPAQIHVNMKNARKETGVPASDKLLANDPTDKMLFENQVFSEKPAPRQPESPDVESLRSLLKANLLREPASPALLQRIRSRMHDQKD